MTPTQNLVSLPYKPLDQASLDPIVKSPVKIWYPDQKNCKREDGELPVLGRDYITPIKAHILVMLLVELQKTFKKNMCAQLNGSRLLQYVAPNYDKSNDHDVSVIITDSAEDKYRSFNKVDRIVRYVLGRLLNIEIRQETDLKSVGLKLSPYNMIAPDHYIGSYTFEGADSRFEEKKPPLELSIHCITHPNVPLHFTNLDLYIPLNLYRTSEKKTRLGSVAAGQFCLFSKEVKKGEDISPILENIRNRRITSLAASNPLLTSDPYQYARIIVWITEGLILDEHVLAFFFKGGSLLGGQIAKMLTWWVDRKRKEISQYKFFSASTALMCCPKENPLRDFFITELIQLIQSEDISTSELKKSWISFFHKLMELQPPEEMRSFSILLRLFIPFFASEISLKKIVGKAALQAKFELGSDFLHIPIPMLSEEESQGFPVSEQGDLRSPLEELRFLPLCRAALKEEPIGNLEKEKQIALEVSDAASQENVQLAATRMLTSELLLPEEISVLVPFCRVEQLSQEEIISLIPRLLHACAYVSAKEVESNLNFLHQQLLTGISSKYKKEHCLEWMRDFFKVHQKKLPEWSVLLWREFSQFVSEFAVPTQPWKAFCIAITLGSPLEIPQEVSAFLLALDKKTDNWPVAQCPVLLPTDLKKSLYYLKAAFLLRSVDAWRSFSYLRAALGFPEVVSALESFQKRGVVSKEIDLLDFENTLDQLIHQKEMTRAVTLISCQEHLGDFFQVLSAQAKIFPWVKDKEKLEMMSLETVRKGLQGDAWKAYLYAFPIPKVAEVLEDQFFLHDFAQEEFNKEGYQKAFDFRLDVVDDVERAQLLVGCLAKLGTEKETMKSALIKVFQKCTKEEEKLQVFHLIKTQFPNHMEDLLEFYTLHDISFLHRCIWLLLESDQPLLRQKGWDFFVVQLEPLLKTYKNKSVEIASAYLENATAEERAKLAFACTKLSTSVRLVAHSLFSQAISSKIDLSSFFKEFPWKIETIQRGWDFILLGGFSDSSQVGGFIEGVIEKIPDIYYFNLSQKMIPYCNERSKTIFSKKVQEILQGDMDLGGWKDKMAFLLSPGVVQVVEEDVDLYHEVMKFALKRQERSRCPGLSPSLISTLLDLVQKPLNFSSSGSKQEEIRYNRLSLIFRYREGLKLKSFVDWDCVARDLIAHLDKKPFQDLAREFGVYNPIFPSILLKGVIPHLNSSIDEECIIPFLYEQIATEFPEYIEDEELSFLAQYLVQMYQRFPKDSYFTYCKNIMFLCSKRGLSSEVREEEIWILQKHESRLSEAINQKLDKDVVEELCHIFSYESPALLEVTEGLKKASAYVMEKIGDSSFMKLFEEEKRPLNGLSFFLLRNLQAVLVANPHVRNFAMNQVLYFHIGQVASCDVNPNSYDLMRFFAWSLIQRTEVPESMKQTMEPVVDGATSFRMRPIITGEMAKCSKDLISIFVKNKTPEHLEIIVKLMLNIHSYRMVHEDEVLLEDPSSAFYDIEALCLYFEKIGPNEELKDVLLAFGYKIKNVFQAAFQLDYKRSSKLLHRLLNAMKNLCEAGNKTIMEFYLATSYLDWILHSEGFVISEKFKQKDVMNFLLLRLYEANWPKQGFAIFNSLYIQCIEQGFGDTLPPPLEVFTKCYNDLMKMEKDVNSKSVFLFRDFVRDVYDRCSGYHEDMTYGIDKAFFMKILAEIARLTSPFEDLIIEQIVGSFPKKEEILADWQTWKASHPVELESAII